MTPVQDLQQDSNQDLWQLTVQDSPKDPVPAAGAPTLKALMCAHWRSANSFFKLEIGMRRAPRIQRLQPNCTSPVLSMGGVRSACTHLMECQVLAKIAFVGAPF